jgi:hypothetical protein
MATYSIRQYAIVEQEQRRVDLYTRGEAGWINEVVTRKASLDLSSLGVALDLSALYEDTELDPIRRQPGEKAAPAS